jgi:hypothetical protein
MRDSSFEGQPEPQPPFGSSMSVEEPAEPDGRLLRHDLETYLPLGPWRPPNDRPPDQEPSIRYYVEYVRTTVQDSQGRLPHARITSCSLLLYFLPPPELLPPQPWLSLPWQLEQLPHPPHEPTKILISLRTSLRQYARP